MSSWPWRTASCRGAREVVELAAGECDRRGLEVGDRVAWASRSAADVRADSTGSVWEDSPEPRGRILVASREFGWNAFGTSRVKRSATE